MPTDKVNSSRDREVGECPVLQTIKQSFPNIWKYGRISWGLNPADFRFGSKPRNHRATSQTLHRFILHVSQWCSHSLMWHIFMGKDSFLSTYVHTWARTHTRLCLTVLHALLFYLIFTPFGHCIFFICNKKSLLWNQGAELLCDFSRKLPGNKHIVFPLISNLTLILTHSFLFYHLSVALFRLSQIHNISACASKYVYT